ncbi:hypothetical protein [Sphingopyxis sp. R3-92]
MMKRDPGRGRGWALGIEFWIAMIVVAGSFLAGLWQIARGWF